MILFLALNDEEKSQLRGIYEQYGKAMLSIAYKILKDTHEAQDVVQVSFEKIADILPKLKAMDPKKSKSYIFMIVKNHAIDVYNKRLKVSYLEPEYINDLVDESEHNVDVAMLDFENAQEMAKRLDQINSKYATVITLKYYLELSHKEIAETLACSEGNVRILLHRAKASLKLLLSEEVN